MNQKNRLTLIEKDGKLEVIIPPPRFSSPLTTVCLFSDVLLAFPLLFIAYATYFANPIHKIFLILFAIPWLGGAIAFNVILATCFLDKTLIKVDSEQISIITTLKKANQNRNLFLIQEIIGIKVIDVTEKSPDAYLSYTEILLLLKNGEYSIHKFPRVAFSKEEINLLAEKLKQYIGKNILFE